MEQYIVSARKYRPSTFASVVGQKALTSTLKNAVATGRLAHSYLFCGSRGVGKTSCARIFAKTINCEHRTPDGEPCNECDSCRSFNNGTSMNIIELDAASNNSVDDIRSLVEQTQVPPAQGRYRVFIIDEVHMLTSNAFNAFLKTLEEPPSYVIFILATTEKHKIIPTILSRCQIYDFHRITIPDIIDHLEYVAKSEGITAERAALNVIAQKADGAMRDALSIFDQVAASSGGEITYRKAIDNLNVLDSAYYNRLLDTFLAGDVLGSWVIYKEIRDAGFDSQFMINGLGAYLRDLMLARDPATLALIEAGDEERTQLQERAAKCTPGFLYRAMNLCNEADLNYRTASSKQFLIELTLAKICQSLSPSPNNGSDGEGQLKPIAAARRTDALAPAAAKPANNPANPAPQPAQPAPIAQPQPVAPQPVPAASRPAAAPVRGSGTMLNVPRVSLKHGLGATPQQQNAAQAAATGGARTQDYDEYTFTLAWETVMERHPREHILYNAMRNSRPELRGNRAYVMSVVNELQLQTVTDALPVLIAELRDTLSNDTITLTVEMAVGAETPLYVLNDRELLARLVEEQPMLRKFIEGLQLRIS